MRNDAGQFDSKFAAINPTLARLFRTNSRAEHPTGWTSHAGKKNTIDYLPAEKRGLRNERGSRSNEIHPARVAHLWLGTSVPIKMS